MKFSLTRALIIARREYMTTVKRKAFVFSLLLTPTILFFATFVSQKLSGDQFREHFRQTRIVAVVDSSGLYANAPRRYRYSPPAQAPSPMPTTRQLQPPPARVVVPVIVRPFASQAEALDSLGAGTVNSVLVIANDFVTSGRARRYENDTRAVTSSGDDRPLRWWLAHGLLEPSLDSTRSARVWALGNPIDLYTPTRTGSYEVKDDTRELVAIFLPFVLGMLLSMAIVAGGQYLLQGVTEEKESRILESMLCTVTADDLMVGKLIGLGGAGLTLVGVWIVVGLATMGSTFAFLHIDLPPMLLGIGLLYFLFGYLFFASLMTGIGAVASNMREAQQFAVIFTMMNFFPFWVLMAVVNSPNAPLAVGLSMFPPTAATTMMMRLSAAAISGAVIPPLQIAASLGLLALSAFVTLWAAARIFRLGLLLYGKSPTLPEIMKLVRQG
jgi:ABC-2 type transport system permease protein